mmetsp:Transcript_22707/g.29780  ORF Transcript_22707/g.29780 Transcript_22707/m.29780 type:complete len:303 (-) Transcript_22707:107-1015(-)|eukprot:CAMPEP_0195267248 /NCGR_PEP_ID=MMETSP0706-20130129/12479_1 /TAXON_ID=33640 /ORGANISM="Asterionellopsis glacialis, Strain CCMP134" /LENGTH=302 /DNA_ID=CAMNT_0040321967 /DNA_START=240 /DNA_END=1148 /DNA_ORIENTATION=-
MKILSVFLFVLSYVQAFMTPRIFQRSTHLCRASSIADAAIPSTPVENVLVLQDASTVGDTVRNIVAECAKEAIAERGHFALAIPGGSILKMLVGDDILEDGDVSWTTKTTIAYVNHKCVDMDDMDLATHAKARNLFLDSWKSAHTIIMDGTDDGDAEAAAYENRLKTLSEDVLPRKDDDNGLPIFDLALIGVGDDGHVGSLYPDRDEVLVGADGPWVLPVAMKSPPSITLSLPVMANSKKVIVAACGVSDKYPQGKSAGMRRAVAADDETLQTFPAVGLRSVATWIMDEAAASKLGDTYTNN